MPTGHLHWMGSIPTVPGMKKTLTKKVRVSFMVTRTGIDFIKEHPPSSRRAASAHRALASDGFDSRDFMYEKSPHLLVRGYFSW